MPEIIRWVQKQGTRPAGAPFWRYLVVDMEATLTVDVGVPVAVALEGDSRVIADVLPAGRWATTVFVGAPEGLMRATADLLAWAEKKRISWRMNGGEWAGRLERYLTNPSEEPDRAKWKTELAFLTTEA